MDEPARPVKRDVRRAFERAAETYDAAAVLQREVCERLLSHLDPIRLDPARVADVGCGTGHALAMLSKRFAQAQVIGLDFAPALLSRARAPWWRRLPGLRAPMLVCADAESLPLAGASVQLVFSNLALQWCDPAAVFREAARVLAPEGLFLFSTFGPDTLKEMRAAFAQADSAPHVNPFVDMHDLGDALLHAGLVDPVMEMETLTVEYDTVEALARDLKAIGAVNSLPARSRGLTGRGRWRRMAGAYERFRRNGALPATYEVVYGHAWKVPTRTRSDGGQVLTFMPRPAR